LRLGSHVEVERAAPRLRQRTDPGNLHSELVRHEQPLLKEKSIDETVEEF
jgi:hypothetical protein